MEVVPSEVLSAPSKVPTDVVQSSESTGVPAPVFKPAEIGLSPDVVGDWELQAAIWRQPFSKAASVGALAEASTLQTLQPQCVRSKPCWASTKM